MKKSYRDISSSLKQLLQNDNDKFTKRKHDVNAAANATTVP